MSRKPNGIYERLSRKTGVMILFKRKNRLLLTLNPGWILQSLNHLLFLARSTLMVYYLKRPVRLRFLVRLTVTEFNSINRKYKLLGSLGKKDHTFTEFSSVNRKYKPGGSPGTEKKDHTWKVRDGILHAWKLKMKMGTTENGLWPSLSIKLGSFLLSKRHIPFSR